MNFKLYIFPYNLANCFDANKLRGVFRLLVIYFKVKAHLRALFAQRRLVGRFFIDSMGGKVVKSHLFIRPVSCTSLAFVEPLSFKHRNYIPI